MDDASITAPKLRKAEERAAATSLKQPQYWAVTALLIRFSISGYKNPELGSLRQLWAALGSVRQR